jgi:hypothetical protein
MRPRGTPTRLELHRLRYNQAGRRGALLRLEYLDQNEKDIINREIIQDVRVKRLDFTGDDDERIFDEAQGEVLAEYGVMCPHPKYAREPADLKKVERCTLCRAVVFPLYRTWTEEVKLKSNPEYRASKYPPIQ